MNWKSHKEKTFFFFNLSSIKYVVHVLHSLKKEKKKEGVGRKRSWWSGWELENCCQFAEINLCIILIVVRNLEVYLLGQNCLLLKVNGTSFQSIQLISGRLLFFQIKQFSISSSLPLLITSICMYFLHFSV